MHVSLNKSPNLRRISGFWWHKVTSCGDDMTGAAKRTGIPTPLLYKYFNGAVLPDYVDATTICKVYGVPYDQGYGAFQTVHNRYASNCQSERRTKHKQQSRRIQNPTIPTFEDCLKMLYGGLSHEQFEEVIACSTSHTQLLQYIYGKVNYRIFKKICGK